MSRRKMAKTRSTSKRRPEKAGESPIRTRILEAAFDEFVKRGYGETSTLEIARHAHVSKRELYSLVGNKQEMLIACITERAARMKLAAQTPLPRYRDSLERVLADFGAQLLREVSDPTTMAVFRLAIAEADRTPEIARKLDLIGREMSRTPLTKILANARRSGLISGDPAEMAEQFTALLWGNLMVRLLLRVTNPPTPKEIKRRARKAADAFFRLYSNSD
jgi:AcrR family transcriptional regulator